MNKFAKRLYSSEKIGNQIWGAILSSGILIGVMLLFIILFIIANSLSYRIDTKVWVFLGLNFIVFLIVKTCYHLLVIFNLRKNDSGVTWSYITIMLALLGWLLGFLLIYDSDGNLKNLTVVGAIGAILAWIFQDKIKGIATYLHLRTHKLLKIGDWIRVPSKDVDGVVTKITLTSVTICNWDTTTSIIPINALSTEHFMNLQNMVDGKTYGRKMEKTFIMDTGWFHLLSKDEVKKIMSSGDVAKYLRGEDIHEQISNAKLFRIYLYHWLSNHPHISQHPRLVVRWLEHKDSGMPLQIYAFITDSGLMSFEWQQSQIIEHVIEALNWFGLRLYQSPSSYDTGTSNIYITDTPATHR